MASFLLLEIRNALRLDGFTVTKHTNRRVICDLLDLEKTSTMKDICEKLDVNYICQDEGFKGESNPKEIYLHFLDVETTLYFPSLVEASRELGINIFSSERDSKIIEKIVKVDNREAILSYSQKIDRNLDFPPCLENKVNINLALSSKLGYTVDYEISIPEIFSILGEKIPEHRLKEKLCSLLTIPYYLEKKGGEREMKKIKAVAENETFYFQSISSAGKFFQLGPPLVLKIIEKRYKLPYWFKRYTLEYV